MFETLSRAEPFAAETHVGAGFTVRFAEPMARFSLRARDRAQLEELLGDKLPGTIGDFDGRAMCLGPDEWLLRAPVGVSIALGAGQELSVTDVSERSLCLIVEGPCAAERLMSGCPLDLDRFAVGKATRTIYETVEIVLIRVSERCFHVEVWRSFAPWLWTALTI